MIVIFFVGSSKLRAKFKGRSDVTLPLHVAVKKLRKTSAR